MLLLGISSRTSSRLPLLPTTLSPLIPWQTTRSLLLLPQLLPLWLRNSLSRCLSPLFRPRCHSACRSLVLPRLSRRLLKLRVFRPRKWPSSSRCSLMPVCLRTSCLVSWLLSMLLSLRLVLQPHLRRTTPTRTPPDRDGADPSNPTTAVTSTGTARFLVPPAGTAALALGPLVAVGTLAAPPVALLAAAGMTTASRPTVVAKTTETAVDEAATIVNAVLSAETAVVLLPAATLVISGLNLIAPFPMEGSRFSAVPSSSAE